MWKKYESGQSLLIIVLLISVVFTIIATASYRLTTETQSTRLQEESIKTLAAADSGVERGVQVANTLAETTGGPVTFASLGITGPGLNSTQSTLEVTALEGTAFISPLIPKDEQFTFYLHQYPDGGGNRSQNVLVYFADSTCPNANGPALEITLIYGANGQFVSRWIADPCAIVTSTNGELAIFPANGFMFPNSTTVLQYRVTVPIFSTTGNGANPAQLLIVRTVGRATNVGFSVSTGTLYSQGQTIRSEAVSNNGVTKVVTLFKSYPQIPADFFVTRF